MSLAYLITFVCLVIIVIKYGWKLLKFILTTWYNFVLFFVVIWLIIYFSSTISKVFLH